jgi:hypothetical protein
MPHRDEEKRIAFLRTLAVEDLANRRITEHSSELEKRMVHDARDAMKEKNDERYMTRHKKKAAVDIVKTQFNNVGRRAQAEVFGREGGLTGGMIGSWLLGGTLVGGTIAGILSKGKLGSGQAIGKLTRKRIGYLNKSSLSAKDTDALIGILKKAKKGKLSPEDRVWLSKKTAFYKNREKNSLPFMKEHKNRSKNPNPSGEKPVATKTPVTQPPQNAGNPARKNPNMAAENSLHKEALSKLEKGERLSKGEYLVLHQLKKEGKLTKTQRTLLAARKRSAKSKPTLQTAPDSPPTVTTPASPAVAVPKPDTAAKYSETVLQSMLTKGGQMPSDFPKYPGAVRQLQEISATPGFSLKKNADFSDQVNTFAREIAEVARRSPPADQENICLWLSHKITQANRPIENFGRSLYEKSFALLHEGGGGVKKK